MEQYLFVVLDLEYAEVKIFVESSTGTDEDIKRIIEDTGTNFDACNYMTTLIKSYQTDLTIEPNCFTIGKLNMRIENL